MIPITDPNPQQPDELDDPIQDADDDGDGDDKGGDEDDNNATWTSGG